MSETTMYSAIRGDSFSHHCQIFESFDDMWTTPPWYVDTHSSIPISSQIELYQFKFLVEHKIVGMRSTRNFNSKKASLMWKKQVSVTVNRPPYIGKTSDLICGACRHHGLRHETVTYQKFLDYFYVISEGRCFREQYAASPPHPSKIGNKKIMYHKMRKVLKRS